MKERIFTNRIFTRALYLVMGILVIIQSVMSHQWFGLVFGGYVAAMGLFGFGCASGACFNGSCTTPPQKSGGLVQDTHVKGEKTT